MHVVIIYFVFILFVGKHLFCLYLICWEAFINWNWLLGLIDSSTLSNKNALPLLPNGPNLLQVCFVHYMEHNQYNERYRNEHYI